MRDVHPNLSIFGKPVATATGRLPNKGNFIHLPTWDRAVAITVGLVLLTAALLKSHHLATNPLAGQAWHDSFWFQLGLVQFEIFLGCWLILGLWPKASAMVATLCFVIFALFSAARSMAGEEACGCFGNFTFSPFLSSAVSTLAATGIASSVVSRRFRILAMAVILSLLVVMALRTANDRSGAAYELRLVTQSQIDLGDVWSQDRLLLTVPIHNPTKEIVEISSIAPSCSCAIVNPSAINLLPGSSKSISIALDLGPIRPASVQAPRDFPFKIMFRVQTTGEHLNSNFSIRGTAIAVFKNLAREHNLGVLRLGNRQGCTYSFELHSWYPLSDLKVTSLASSQALPAAPLNDDRTRWNVQIPIADLELGPFRKKIKLQPFREPEAPLPITTFDLIGIGRRNIHAVPSALLLGKVNIGNVIKERFVVKSFDNRSFRIEEIAFQSDSAQLNARIAAFDLTAEEIASACTSQLKNMNVVCKPYSTGLIKGVLRITVSDASHADANTATTIELPVSGLATAANPTGK